MNTYSSRQVVGLRVTLSELGGALYCVSSFFLSCGLYEFNNWSDFMNRFIDNISNSDTKIDYFLTY